MQMELMDINSRMDEGCVDINFRITGAFVYMVKVSLLLQHCTCRLKYRIERPGRLDSTLHVARELQWHGGTGNFF